jgi:hypothetical protein
LNQRSAESIYAALDYNFARGVKGRERTSRGLKFLARMLGKPQAVYSKFSVLLRKIKLHRWERG